MYVAPLSTVKRNENGIMWIKFDKVFFNLESDLYVCHCYIPPENSRLYLTVDNLRNFDFIDCISEDAVHPSCKRSRKFRVGWVDGSLHFIS